jgi:hypothetical protein
VSMRSFSFRWVPGSSAIEDAIMSMLRYNKRISASRSLPSSAVSASETPLPSKARRISAIDGSGPAYWRLVVVTLAAWASDSTPSGVPRLSLMGSVVGFVTRHGNVCLPPWTSARPTSSARHGVRRSPLITWSRLGNLVFVVTGNTASDIGGITTGMVVATTGSFPVSDTGTAVSPSNSVIVLVRMSTTACASLKKSIPSIRSMHNPSTTETIVGTITPPILISTSTSPQYWHRRGVG